MDSTNDGSSSSKRKRTEKAFGFPSLAGEGRGVRFPGSFRDNVRLFLRERAKIEDCSVEGMAVWCSFLELEKRGFSIPLYVVEENVVHSSHHFCNHCRSVGWSYDYMPRRHYHMIIPADDNWDKLNSNAFNCQNHLLHGLIHCNGFGHLLCINGHEGGSKHASGSDLMNLWDQICTSLRALQITVEDRSVKRPMELRLLYATAYGQPWLRRRGYNFCCGSFRVTENMYMNAIQTLSSLHLDTIMDDFRQTNSNREIRHIVESYQKISNNRLETLQDLLRFMLGLRARLVWSTKSSNRSATATHQPMPKTENQYLEFSKMADGLSSRWSGQRLFSAAQVIVYVLKEKKASGYGNVWMMQQEVRDAARLHIGDTGLLDFVLESLDGYTIGNQVIIRGTNPSTQVREYTVEDLDGEPGVSKSIDVKIREEILRQDLVHMYKHVLEDYPQGGQLSEIVQLAAGAIVKYRHFEKQWPFPDKDEDNDLLRYWVVAISPAEEMWLTAPPAVLVVLPSYATVGELKVAGEQALRDTYCGMGQFEVQGIVGVGVDDDEVVFRVLESGSCVRLRGSGLEKRCEGGPESWRVDCTCGAQDHDGQRMVACDICQAWKHTRCEGIDDSDGVPPRFLCRRCGTELQQLLEWSISDGWIDEIPN